jgi:hypothetical protein
MVTLPYARETAVLTEKALEENGARSEHSPRKSLTRLAQETQASTTTAWSATEKLRLLTYKIRQVQVIEDRLKIVSNHLFERSVVCLRPAGRHVKHLL